MTQDLKTEPSTPIELKRPSGLKGKVYFQATIDAFVKLNPRWMVRNPVMFVTELAVF